MSQEEKQHENAAWSREHFQPTHRRQGAVDKSVCCDRYHEEGGEVPAEHLDAGDSYEGWYADHTAEALPGSDAHLVDEGRENEELKHRYEEA